MLCVVKLWTVEITYGISSTNLGLKNDHYWSCVPIVVVKTSSFARSLLKQYYQFLTLIYATSLLFHYNFIQLASEPMFLSEKALTETVSWLGDRKKTLFSVSSQMRSLYILFILAPHWGSLEKVFVNIAPIKKLGYLFQGFFWSGEGEAGVRGYFVLERFVFGFYFLG